MRINFHGAAQTVTGSQHLLEINGYRLLLDCGLYQGRRQDTYERNLKFAYDPRKVDAVILSHAHIDHAGNLPNLVKQGYDGPIHCTSATRDLCSIMLVDSAHIQADDAKFVSKKLAKKDKPPVEALYSMEDAEKAVRQLKGVSYEQPVQVVDGVTVTFRDAGHILGSAQVILDNRGGSGEGDAPRRFRV